MYCVLCCTSVLYCAVLSSSAALCARVAAFAIAHSHSRCHSPWPSARSRIARRRTPHSRVRRLHSPCCCLPACLPALPTRRDTEQCSAEQNVSITLHYTARRGASRHVVPLTTAAVGSILLFSRRSAARPSRFLHSSLLSSLSPSQSQMSIHVLSQFDARTAPRSSYSSSSQLLRSSRVYCTALRSSSS